jgi:carboxylesterase
LIFKNKPFIIKNNNKGVGKMNLIKEEVIIGAESFFLKGNEIGILLSHGFVGTPQSVREIGEMLNQEGFTVYAPRLTGHGTSMYDMEQAKYTDWIEDLEEAYLQLKQSCQQIFVIGQSMGGALCLRLAGKFPEIQGVITINAALHVPAYDPFRNGNGPRFLEEGAPDIKDKSAQEITYDAVPLKAVNELQKFLDETQLHLWEVRIPALIMTSEVDHVVPPSDSTQILQEISSIKKEQVILHNSYHVASLDFDKEKIVRSCKKFIKKLQINSQHI